MQIRRFSMVAVRNAVVLGIASTVGDWIWTNYLQDGALVPALLHGLLIFVLLSLVLGWSSGSRRATRRLLATLPIGGLTIAAIFYPMASFVGYLSALLISWSLMWIAMAVLMRWANRSSRQVGREFLWGLVAALCSGLAFWSISGVWTQSEAYTSYWVRWLAWTWAFLPGFLALELGFDKGRQDLGIEVASE